MPLFCLKISKNQQGFSDLQPVYVLPVNCVSCNFSLLSFIYQTQDSFSGFGLPSSLQGKLENIFQPCPVCSKGSPVNPDCTGNDSHELQYPALTWHLRAAHGLPLLCRQICCHGERGAGKQDQASLEGSKKKCWVLFNS